MPKPTLNQEKGFLPALKEISRGIIMLQENTRAGFESDLSGDVSANRLSG
jgi:hypothetical protein